MSYGQPWRSTTGLPPEGPTSAYPKLSTPASICLSGGNSVFCGTAITSAQRLERGTHFLAEYPRLFPGSEVAASVELVVMDEVVEIRTLCPPPRGLIQLV